MIELCDSVSAKIFSRTSFKWHQHIKENETDGKMKSQWNIHKAGMLIDFSLRALLYLHFRLDSGEGKKVHAKSLTDSIQNKLEFSLVTFKSICTCISELIFSCCRCHNHIEENSNLIVRCDWVSFVTSVSLNKLKYLNFF